MTSRFCSLVLLSLCCSAAPLWAQSTAVPARIQIQDPAFPNDSTKKIDKPFPAPTVAGGGGTTTIDLRDYFELRDLNSNGVLVQFTTNYGKFNVQLRRDIAPRHVDNFLRYMNSGRYNETVFHRIASFNGVIGSIVQGGGYKYPVPLTEVQKDAAINLEYNASLPNRRGTIAAARTSDVNSATSEFYFNTTDNSATLGPSNGGGYSVFGEVMGLGILYLDFIAGRPAFRVNDTLTTVPLRASFDSQSRGLQTEDLIHVISVKPIAAFPATAGDEAIVRFFADSSDPDILSTSVAGPIVTLTGKTGGTASVTVRALDTNNSAAFITVTATVTPAVSIKDQPQSVTVAPGSTATLSVTATPVGTTPVTYQWSRNGTPVAGATGSALTLANAQTAQEGDYAVTVTQGAASVTSQIAVVRVAAPETGRLLNLSVRGLVERTTFPVIAGIGVTGSGPKPVVIRAVGPTLDEFGLADLRVGDPTMVVRSGDSVVAENDNWSGDYGASVGAFPLKADSRDAALTTSLNPGTYSTVVTAKIIEQPNSDNTGTVITDDGFGITLTEVFDLQPTGPVASRLTNLSARAFVGTGGDVIIVGFTLSGTAPKRLLLRAVGPTLAQFGVANVLANPRLDLYRGDSILASNDNWELNGNVDAIRAIPGPFALPAGSRDAALFLNVQPGAYTVRVQGVNFGRGVALVELYDLD